MVFVWSRLSNGDPLFTLSQVAVNDTIMVCRLRAARRLPAGAVGDHRAVGYAVTSVVLYIVIPVIAQLVAQSLLKKGQPAFDAAMAKIGPWSIAALLATLVLLFAFQGEAIIAQPLVIALLAVPILIRSFQLGAGLLAQRAVGENTASPARRP